MTDWRAVKAVSPEIIWNRYADAIGTELLQQTFGAHWPPAGVRPGEEVWCFRDPDASPRPFDPADHPAAWLSLALDQFDPQKAHMSRAVWPDQHGQGLGRIMRMFAERWCEEHGAMSLHIVVHVANREHLVNVMADPYWEMDGWRFRPPAYTFTHALRA